MKVYLDVFIHNDPNLKLEDVITNLQAGEKGGVINTRFRTRDKYLSVDANTYNHRPEYEGKGIVIISITYNDPNYFYINLGVEMPSGESYNSIVTPLKHEYLVSFVPDSLMFDYKTLKEVEIITNFKEN